MINQKRVSDYTAMPHSSRKTHKNVSIGNKLTKAADQYSGLLMSAEQKAVAWSDIITDQFCSRNETQIAVICAIYDLSWSLRNEQESRMELLKTHGVKTSKSIKNWVFSVVKLVLRRSHEACRSTSQITKIAGAIRLGIDADINPEAYSEFLISKGGYCVAYQEYAGNQNSKGDQKIQDNIMTLELVEDYINSSPPSEEYATPDLLAGFAGRQVVIVEMVQPGGNSQGGCFRIIKNLGFPDDEINRILKRAAKNANKPSKNGRA